MIKPWVDESIEGEYMEYKDRRVKNGATKTSPLRKGRKRGAAWKEWSEKSVESWGSKCHRS